jgi:hypothetical protein
VAEITHNPQSCLQGAPATCVAYMPTHSAGVCLVSLACRPAPLAADLQFVDRYVSVAAGPAKWSKLVEFLRATYPRITADLVNRQQNQVGACGHDGRTHCNLLTVKYMGCI